MRVMVTVDEQQGFSSSAMLAESISPSVNWSIEFSDFLWRSCSPPLVDCCHRFDDFVSIYRACPTASSLDLTAIRISNRDDVRKLSAVALAASPVHIITAKQLGWLLIFSRRFLILARSKIASS